MSEKFIPYKTVIKKLMKKSNLSEKEFIKMMEKGEIKVNAMHPILKIILPYKIEKIYENGQIKGEFIQ